jgi:hypothetical protein
MSCNFNSNSKIPRSFRRWCGLRLLRQLKSPTIATSQLLQPKFQLSTVTVATSHFACNIGMHLKVATSTTTSQVATSRNQSPARLHTLQANNVLHAAVGTSNVIPIAVIFFVKFVSFRAHPIPPEVLPLACLCQCSWHKYDWLTGMKERGLGLRRFKCCRCRVITVFLTEGIPKTALRTSRFS